MGRDHNFNFDTDIDAILTKYRDTDTISILYEYLSLALSNPLSVIGPPYMYFYILEVCITTPKQNDAIFFEN